MEIYISHSTSIDFRKKLYRPIMKSKSYEHENIKLPHINTKEDLFDSETYFRRDCDLVIFDATESTTGGGIELGWADAYNIDIVCIHQKNSTPSDSIKAVTDEFYSYSVTELSSTIDHIVNTKRS
jgi:hypothetical protein